ncbi:RNA-directed DNA polymerase, eukaryota, reverse transcriptase zinc-binding domain protein [Tanacetum coccineum]
MGDIEWIEVRRKKQGSVFNRLKFPQQSMADDLAKISFSVYVSNLPSHLTVREIWNICGKKGTLADVFIAKHKNKLGQMFGFCRFIKVTNSETLINSLNNIWIGKLHLHANIARYDRKAVVKRSQVPLKVSPLKDVTARNVSSSNTTTSFAKVVKNSLSNCGNDSSGASEINIPSISLTHDTPTDFLMELFGCFKDFRSIANTRTMCSNEGFLDVDIKYLGGLWLWHDDFVVEERLFWLEIEGIPIRAWNNDIFTQICRKWGEVLFMDDSDHWTPSFISNDSDSNGASSIGLFEKQGDNLFEKNDVDSDIEILGNIGAGEDIHDKGVYEHVDKTDIRASTPPPIMPISQNNPPVDSDPFGLGPLINKKSNKGPNLSNTPAFPPGFSPKNDKHQTSDSTHNFSSKEFIRQPGFSLLARLEETIKVGLDLGLNMEGCEKTLASLIADKGETVPKSSLLGLAACVSIVRALLGVALEKGIPDHRTILLKEFHVDYGPTPFWFFHSWLEMEGFQNLVVDTWNNDGIVHANSLVSFKKKLQNLKHVIRAWVGSKKFESSILKKKHQELLSSIDVKIEHDIASEEDFIHRRDALKSLGALDRLKKRRRQLAIKGTMKNGVWIEEPSIVKAEFMGHFRHRFQQPTCIPPSLDTDLLNPLPSSQRDFLERPFSRDEIKRVVWDCGGDRAPGPNGFTFKFFTSFWDLIEDDVVRFMHEFFCSNFFPKGCNSSFIALILKVSNAKSVSDFWPISLIGCQYKIIRKLLVNRLSTVIRDCVSTVQSTFIKGRNILDDPLTLNEVLAWYCRHLIMDKLGFGSKWRAWINGCLHNARFSVLVNGSPTEEFKVFRGLRQGDPTSPFLFILAIEGLHALISKADALGVGVTEEEVSYMANIIGCGASKFPLKYLGVLLVLGNLPIYYMSIYLMPMSIRKKLESMRNKFFIGGDPDEKKITWIKWDRCLASKEDSGLRIDSIYGLNIGLLFKWIGRFLCNHSDLWVRVIKSIHDLEGGINIVSNKGLKCSTWGSISSSINSLKSKGFSLTSVRHLVDSYILDTGHEATRWNRSLRIKVNVFLWRLKLNKLPSRVNLDRRGIEVSSLLCPSCHGDIETVNHSFFNCDMAKDLWSLLSNWWELDIPVCGNIAKWYDWLVACMFLLRFACFLRGGGDSYMAHLELSQLLETRKVSVTSKL